MVSGIHRKRARSMTTSTSEAAAEPTSPNGLIYMQPWFTANFSDILDPRYGQLTPVKTRYLLTSIALPYRGLKFRANWGHLCFKLTADQVIVFNWNAGPLQSQQFGLYIIVDCCERLMRSLSGNKEFVHNLFWETLSGLCTKRDLLTLKQYKINLIRSLTYR